MSKRVLGKEYKQVTATGMFYLILSGSGISIYDMTMGGFFCFLHIFLEMIFFPFFTHGERHESLAHEPPYSPSTILSCPSPQPLK